MPDHAHIIINIAPPKRDQVFYVKIEIKAESAEETNKTDKEIEDKVCRRPPHFR